MRWAANLFPGDLEGMRERDSGVNGHPRKPRTFDFLSGLSGFELGRDHKCLTDDVEPAGLRAVVAW